MDNIDLVVIGGGSAGLAAAIQAKNDGIDNIIIIEKDDTLGGILNQCIHNGFGLTEFKEELTGPEYYERFVLQVEKLGIKYLLNSLVTFISKDKVVSFSSKELGACKIQAKAIIVATGCYERSAGAIKLSGSRCSGIMTAGIAQKYLNIYGFPVGKKVVVLGSGDIGLIMARRLTLQGAKVACVCEIKPYSSGLPRNITQCLDDFDIPLYLSTSVKKVIGNDRLQKVVLCKVDENKKFIDGTEKEIECDTLILSVGLIPYITLLNLLGCEIGSTKGATVNNYLETNIEGIFTCGNCLHVHDVVDYVTKEGREAGHSAALYINGKMCRDEVINTICGNGISYIVPQRIYKGINDDFELKFRVKHPFKQTNILIKNEDGSILKSIPRLGLNPSEMEIIKLNNELLNSCSNLIVEVDE